MKKAMLFIFIVFISLSLSAQKSKVSFFSEDGQKFWLIINDEEVNQKPHYNVKDYETDADFINVKINFPDPHISSIDKTIPCKDADGKPTNRTWVVKEIEGKWKLIEQEEEEEEEWNPNLM